MKFTVEIPDDVIQWANAEGVNRQMIAKFIREELQSVGTRYGHSPDLGRAKFPGQGDSHDWRAWILNALHVRCNTAAMPKAKEKKKQRGRFPEEMFNG
jgi:hypothetical protein